MCIYSLKQMLALRLLDFVQPFPGERSTVTFKEESWKVIEIFCSLLFSLSISKETRLADSSVNKL